MYSCYVVYVNGRQWAIVHTERDAENLIRVLWDAGYEFDQMRYEGAYHVGVGF